MDGEEGSGPVLQAIESGVHQPVVMEALAGTGTNRHADPNPNTTTNTNTITGTGTLDGSGAMDSHPNPNTSHASLDGTLAAEDAESMEMTRASAATFRGRDRMAESLPEFSNPPMKDPRGSGRPDLGPGAAADALSASMGASTSEVM